jgi:hypothetical protein
MHSNNIGIVSNRRPELGRLVLTKEQKRDLLRSLNFDQINAREMTIRTAHTKTCKWLLKNSEYLNWLDAGRLNEHHGFL